MVVFSILVTFKVQTRAHRKGPAVGVMWGTASLEEHVRMRVYFVVFTDFYASSTDA